MATQTVTDVRKRPGTPAVLASVLEPFLPLLQTLCFESSVKRVPVTHIMQQRVVQPVSSILRRSHKNRNIQMVAVTVDPVARHTVCVVYHERLGMTRGVAVWSPPQKFKLTVHEVSARLRARERAEEEAAAGVA